MRTVIPPAPTIGLCIATHSCAAYVHLNLESQRRHNPGLPILVHDDSSDHQSRLRELCQQYGADFVSTPFRLAPTLGDLSAFAKGLEWARDSGFDVVVKCSRRFILAKPWVAGLQELMHGTQYATASNCCAHFGFGFRSELVALYMPAWRDSGVMAELVEAARRNEPYDPLPEAYYHRKTVEVHKWLHPTDESASHASDSTHPDCDYLVRSEGWYGREKNNAENYSGYALWPIMGLHRNQRDLGTLWHDSHTPSDYLALSQEYGLPYELADFEIRCEDQVGAAYK